MSEKEEINKKKELEIRSQAFEEIIGRPPKWIIRWGITVFFFISIVMLLMTWVFKYPDIIEAPVVIITENVSATLTSKANGSLEKVFFNEGDSVKAGDFIAVIENTANYNHIIVLFSIIDKLQVNNALIFNNVDSINSIFENTFTNVSISNGNNNTLINLNLGNIDVSWSSFFSKWYEYYDYLKNDYDGQKIDALKKRYGFYGKLLIQHEKQLRINKEDLSLSIKQFDRDSALFLKTVISASEFELSKKNLLQKKAGFETMRTSLIQSQLQCNETEQLIIEMENNRANIIKQYQIALSQLFSALLASAEQWKMNFLIVSPINGKLSYPKVWTKNQNISIGEPVATIIPFEQSKIIGKVSLSVIGSGKVKIGQNVNIKLNNYPFLEFGMLRAKISSISLVPHDNTYLVELEILQDMKTNYGITIEFRQEMTGTAEIITEDMRLIERLINPIKHILKKQ